MNEPEPILRFWYPPDPRFLFRVDNDIPTKQDLAHPLLAAIKANYSSAKSSPLVCKKLDEESQLKSDRVLRIVPLVHCIELSDVLRLYEHAAGVKQKTEQWMDSRGNIVVVGIGPFIPRPEDCMWDQRYLPETHRWDMDLGERKSWRRIMASRNSGTVARRVRLDGIEKQRRVLDNEGIPNYVLWIFEEDWCNLKEFVLAKFPARGRKGPFTLDNGSGISQEVRWWLSLMHLIDGRTQKRRLVDAEYLEDWVPSRQVKAPPVGLFSRSPKIPAREQKSKGKRKVPIPDDEESSDDWASAGEETEEDEDVLKHKNDAGPKPQGAKFDNFRAEHPRKRLKQRCECEVCETRMKDISPVPGLPLLDGV